MPNLNNVSSPSFWQRLWQGFWPLWVPSSFSAFFRLGLSGFAILAGICLLIGSVWVLLFAPPDYLQAIVIALFLSMSQRASSTFLSILWSRCIRVIYLVWKINRLPVWRRPLALIGFCSVISLITALFGQTDLGHLLGLGCAFDLYADFGVLYAGSWRCLPLFEHTANRGKAAAILSIVGAVNLPIIGHRWSGGIPASRRNLYPNGRAKDVSRYVMPLLLMTIGSYLLVATLAIYRTNTLILYRDQGKAWVKEYPRSTK